MGLQMLRWQPKQGFKVMVVIALAAIAALVLTPAWANGQWPWTQPLEAPGLNQVKALTDTSLSLPNWEVSSSEAISINRQEWGLSEYIREAPANPNSDDIRRIGLLLLPQSWHDDQPTVEWVDLRGAQNWRIADTTALKFRVDTGEVRARYFQARTDQQTFAVLQWYAWPGGGDFTPARWFWVDQLSQWRSGQRTPWVAVCLLLPIQPLGDISRHQETTIRLAQAVQTALQATALGGE